MLIGLANNMERGFSLIELLIAMAVLGVLVALGMPSFNNWLQSTQIRNAAESIQNGLQLTRAEAVRRNTSINFVLTSAGSAAWTIRCVVPVGDLNGDGVADCPGMAVVPTEIQIQPVAEGSRNAVVASAQSTVTFNGMGRAAPAMVIDITNPTGGACDTAGPMRCLRVIVSAGGQVRMCDPALASTDPRGC